MPIPGLPIHNQLQNYNREKLKADALAGFTVAVTLIPQGLAYGSLARLPVQYGLYSGFVGGFIYLLFGTAKDITLGPTAIMSLFVAQYCNGSIHLAGAMTFYSGLVLVFAFAFLGIGGCISDFISQHVITGFCSAASFITTITQIPKVFGLKVKSRSPLGILTELWMDIVFGSNQVMVGNNEQSKLRQTRATHSIHPTANLIDNKFSLRHNDFENNAYNNQSSLQSIDLQSNHVNFHDLFIGIFSICALNIMKNLPSISKKYFHCESKHLKTISTARNAILAFTLALFSYFTCHSKKYGDTCKYTLITIDVEHGNSGISFHEPELTLDNFRQLASNGALFIIPFMGFLESISIARTFGKQFGYRPDEFWESFAIGMSNIVGSFFGSFPVTGSFSRTALNASTGVRTTFGGIITSVTVIFALEVMLHVFHYIPKASLGAIIICAAAHMFDPVVLEHGQKLFQVANHHLCQTFGIRSSMSKQGRGKYDKLQDFQSNGHHQVIDNQTKLKENEGLECSLACFITFVVCFYGLAVGILLGLGVSVASILYKVSHPKLNYEQKDNKLIITTSSDTLSYSSCNYIYGRVQDILTKFDLIGQGTNNNQGSENSHEIDAIALESTPNAKLKSSDSTDNLNANQMSISVNENSLSNPLSNNNQSHNNSGSYSYDCPSSNTNNNAIKYVKIDLKNVRNLDNDVYFVFTDFKKIIEERNKNAKEKIIFEIHSSLSEGVS